MNRTFDIFYASFMCVPRRRGDEPKGKPLHKALVVAFPAGAGMNRNLCYSQRPTTRVPRRRGDEPPLQSLAITPSRRSPQARG